MLELLWSLYAFIGKTDEGNDAWDSFSKGSTCPTCNGTGTIIGDIDPDRMIATELSLKKGAVLLWAGTICGPVVKIKQLAKMIGIDYERPLAHQDEKFTDILLYGYDKEPVTYVHNKKERTNYYRGCVFDLTYMSDAGTTSKGNSRAIKLFSQHQNCPNCTAHVLNQKRLVTGKSVSDVIRMPIQESLLFMEKLRSGLDKQLPETCIEWIHEIALRLTYLNKTGLTSLSAFDVTAQSNKSESHETRRS